MNCRIINIAGFAALCFVPIVLAASEPAVLANNPFSRPPALVASAGSPTDSLDGPSRMIDLRATMVGKSGRYAMIGNRVIRPGEEIDGYTLQQVFEDRAVFAVGGKRFTVNVRPERKNDDD